MKYLFGVLGVAIVQVGLTFAIIQLTRGGGSFVALGAMLFAVIGIPVTALINFLLIRTGSKNQGSSYAFRVFVVSLLLPAAQLALMVLVSAFRL